MKFISFCLTALIILSMTSCSSKKTMQESAAAPARRPGVAALLNPEANTLADTYLPWTTLYVPFNLRLSKPVGFNISGRATMVRDKAVQLSMRMLGMEVAVAYITPDSAKIVDKFHKYIVSVPFSAIASKTKLSVGDLQDILLGRAFYPGSGTIKRGEADSQFSINRDGDNLILTPRRVPAGASWYFTVAPGPELRRISVKPEGLDAFIVSFGDIVSTVAGSVASTVEADGKFRSKELEASVSWNMDKAKWNEERTVEVPDYSNYKHLSISDLINVLKKF